MEANPKLESLPAPLADSAEPQKDLTIDRARRMAIRRKILKDSRHSAKGYILAFTVPAGGE